MKSIQIQEIQLGQFKVGLAPLPSLLRYYDDFLEKDCSIRHPTDLDEWSVWVDGYENKLDFTVFQSNLQALIKAWIAYLLQSLSPGTARAKFSAIKSIPFEHTLLVVSSEPTSIRAIWQTLLAKDCTISQMDSLKSVLNFLCIFNLAGWSKAYVDFLSTLPLPFVDKYASVRGGDVFLDVAEEAALVGHFDDRAQRVTALPSTVSDEELTAVTILLCSYQFGFRPKQIGKLQMRDVRIYTLPPDNRLHVHLTFFMVKQKSQAKVLPLVRKVKQDWAPLFVELIKRAEMKGLSGGDRVFGVVSAHQVGRIIATKTGEILPNSRSATDLRHTAAQRLVDAGASHEELAAFMGHSDIDTGLVYFNTSPNQAELVNRALGISSIYRKIAKIAHSRFISADELVNLKAEQQIGGVPHGIPIAGIGGCSTGQPSCPYNPVTGCYGCPKFMPVSDIGIHKKVLSDLRSVVLSFVEASRDGNKSPSYLQLERTISLVKSVIVEIEDYNK